MEKSIQIFWNPFQGKGAYDIVAPSGLVHRDLSFKDAAIKVLFLLGTYAGKDLKIRFNVGDAAAPETSAQ